MSIKQDIKQMAYDAATTFLNEGVELNDTIGSMYSEDLIENPEILKRVCEAANNTVYMTMFKNKNVDRSQIKFPLADAQHLLNLIDQENGPMIENTPIDYLVEPRLTVVTKTASLDEGLEKIANVNTENESSSKRKLAIQKMAQIESTAKNLVYSLEIVKTAAERNAESLLNDYVSHGIDTISSGESFADMTKIAMRSVVDNFGETGITIVKKASQHALGKLKSRGFKTNNELTKISSEVINGDNELCCTSNDLVLELEKAAACTELINSIKKTQGLIKGIRDGVSA